MWTMCGCPWALLRHVLTTVPEGRPEGPIEARQLGRGVVSSHNDAIVEVQCQLKAQFSTALGVGFGAALGQHCSVLVMMGFGWIWMGGGFGVDAVWVQARLGCGWAGCTDGCPGVWRGCAPPCLFAQGDKQGAYRGETAQP
jgi:hypothetical protein